MMRIQELRSNPILLICVSLVYEIGWPLLKNLFWRCTDLYSVDITEGIPKSGNYSLFINVWSLWLTIDHSLAASLNFCRNCDRFLSPPSTWTIAQPESRELLAICLKKLKGLNKVRLVDAGFIWTEPHSKRLRVKMTIQKEVSRDVLLFPCISLSLPLYVSSQVERIWTDSPPRARF